VNGVKVVSDLNNIKKTIVMKGKAQNQSGQQSLFGRFGLWGMDDDEKQVMQGSKELDSDD
jgi:hypothetical protein